MRAGRPAIMTKLYRSVLPLAHTRAWFKKQPDSKMFGGGHCVASKSLEVWVGRNGRSTSVELRNCRCRLFASRASIHVDFHADRHFDDFWSLPSHPRSPRERATPCRPRKDDRAAPQIAQAGPHVWLGNLLLLIEITAPVIAAATIGDRRPRIERGRGPIRATEGCGL